MVWGMLVAISYLRKLWLSLQHIAVLHILKCARFCRPRGGQGKQEVAVTLFVQPILAVHGVLEKYIYPMFFNTRYAVLLHLHTSFLLHNIYPDYFHIFLWNQWWHQFNHRSTGWSGFPLTLMQTFFCPGNTQVTCTACDLHVPIVAVTQKWYLNAWLPKGLRRHGREKWWGLQNRQQRRSCVAYR